MTEHNQGQPATGASASIAETVGRLETAADEALGLLGGIVQMIETEMGPEAMNRWSRVEPSAVLAEVYARLAAPMAVLQKGLESR